MKITFRISLIVLLFLMLLITCTNCSSKKNVVSTQKEVVSLTSENASQSDVKSSLVSDSLTNSIYHNISTSKDETIQGDAIHDSIPVEVSKTNQGNTSSWKFKGLKNIKIGNSETSQQTDQESTTKLGKSQNTESQKKERTLSEKKTSKKTKDSNRESKGISSFMGIGFGLGMLVLLIIIYNKRKSIFAFFKKKKNE